MLLIVKKNSGKTIHPVYLQVLADVRYWEDATVNGQKDTDGSLIPLKSGKTWMPVINLETGVIQDWPKGATADVHYKVCDAGEYKLLDAERKEIAKWSGYYVPDDLLCPNEDGWGDYIIMKIDADGKIEGRNGALDGDDWVAP